MIGVVSEFEEYMQSWFQYVLTILGAAAAIHWMFEGVIRSTWEWISSNMQAGGLLAALFVIGVIVGPMLAYNNDMVGASIVLVFTLVNTVDGSRVLRHHRAAGDHS